MSDNSLQNPLVLQAIKQQLDLWNQMEPSPSIAVFAEFMRSTPEEVEMALELEMPDLLLVKRDHEGTIAGAIAELRINS